MLKISHFLALTLATLPACLNINVGTTHLSGQTYSTRTMNGSANLDNVTVTETLTVNGSATISESNIKNLTTHGSANLQKTTINGHCQTHGSLISSESTIHQLTTRGSANLYETMVHELCDISGSLIAQSSTLNRMIVSSKRITLINSKTKTIHIRKQTGPCEQIVELNNTTVDGDITFESGEGKILLKSNSKITGKVVGGRIEKY